MLFESYGVSVHVLHDADEAGESAPEQELMADFMALIASFSGRLYGQRSAAAKRRLLARAQERTAGANS
jgi:predicted site-specific integrase-resolvase